MKKGFVALCLFVAAALPALAQQKVMIADPSTNCATSNPFPKGNERITWTGGCRNGLLDGDGVLTWYRDDRLTERNEGSFRGGELHGNATTTFPDGSSVVGVYNEGRRNGEFIVIRGDGAYIRALYQNDRLVSERELSRRQVRALIDERRSQPAQVRPREVPQSAEVPVYQAPLAYAPPVQPAPAPSSPAPVIAAPLAAAPAVATAAGISPPSPGAASSYVPPWSPTANAAALSGRSAAYPAPAPVAPVYPQPAYRVPAYQPSVYATAPAVPQTPYQQVYNPYAGAVTPAAPQTAAVSPAAIAGPIAQPSAVAAPAGMVSRRVCTAPGLYPNNAGWCGIVRAEQPGEVQVEVTDVRVNSIFAIGISPGECTGSEFIGSGSKGSKIWVPARCMR